MAVIAAQIGMIRLLNVVLAVIALIGAWILVSFKNHLTLRAIHSASTIYKIPYETHGGTVYVSLYEHYLLIGGWIFTGSVVAAQIAINYIQSRKK